MQGSANTEHHRDYLQGHLGWVVVVDCTVEEEHVDIGAGIVGVESAAVLELHETALERDLAP